ncbi:MAG TPA: DNA polymerase III subunit chi [Arenimonas sp.]|uniref:DNA polymerase III subunit chi n=1 Tax=Arenimonas sp. TaxID=1872635 RepID=UPI002CA5E609|nr:DNA polymerase III subunit chi [Arenimonas sp.]HMB57835.1 DNA polymerase III subunit chi [Arenimonas sp.]
MPRADFYLIAKPRFLDKPLLLVCELARKACDGGQPMLIFVASPQQAEVLDELLWEFDPDAYIPHQIAGTDEDDELTPVLIVPPGVTTPMRALVLNLRNDAVAGNIERVLEVVPADASSREPLRERWKQYKERGFEVSKFDM